MGTGVRSIILLAILCCTFVGVLLFAPVSQDPLYHAFADQRTILGTPHFLDVVTNLPFLVTGIVGVITVANAQVRSARWSWIVFFVAILLVGIGSAYYHVDPNDATLVWDRMPMTVGFVSVLVAVLSERVCRRVERYALGPAIAAGLSSVAWWVLSGDLRPYVFIQVLPLIAIPAVVLLGPAWDRKSLLFCGAVAIYILAKVLELNDRAIFVATQHAISGHSLKHLVAAAGCAVMLIMFVRRRTAEGVLLVDTGKIPGGGRRTFRLRTELPNDLDVIHPRHR